MLLETIYLFFANIVDMSVLEKRLNTINTVYGYKIWGYKLHRTWKTTLRESYGQKVCGISNIYDFNSCFDSKLNVNVFSNILLKKKRKEKKRENKSYEDRFISFVTFLITIHKFSQSAITCCHLNLPAIFIFPNGE